MRKNVTGTNSRPIAFGAVLPLMLAAVVASFGAAAADPGVSRDKIVIGGVMDLEGRSSALGQGMKDGVMAALKGKRVKGRTIEYVTLNDSYNPTRTVDATRDLLERGIFVMVGNVGTPTAKVSLPLLEKAGVPAIGFFTGAGLLRPGKGNIVNFRASYVQEAAAVIGGAIDSGLQSTEICAYVQNDAYGMAGIAGIKASLVEAGGADEIVASLDAIMQLEGENPYRNNQGPVGVYKRNTLAARDGYLSLKNWEKRSGHKCRLVVTVGAYASIANFIGYAAMKGENWIYSAVSFTGAENLQKELKNYGVTNNLIVTQVVPPLDSKLPIVRDARAALGDKLSYVSLEGYVVGRFLLQVLESIPDKDISRKALMAAINGRKFDVGGLVLDYSNDNQGSDLVISTYLDNDAFNILGNGEMRKLLR